MQNSSVITAVVRYNISGCRKIHGVAHGKGFAHVLMVCSIALD